MFSFKGSQSSDSPLDRRKHMGWSSPSPTFSHAHITQTKKLLSRLTPAQQLQYKNEDFQHFHNPANNVDLLTSRFHQIGLEESSKLCISSKKGKKRCSFLLLPDDVIVKIFSNLMTDQLCRCARVCQRWYLLSWDPTLWTDIIINNRMINIDKALKFLTKRLSYNTPTVCVIVEKINLNSCERLTDKGLHTVAKRCPELRHFELQGCSNISNPALFELVSRCVNLEHLNLSGCGGIKCISLTDSILMRTSAHHLRQIYVHYLDMTDCILLDDGGLQITAMHCSQLQFLYLRRCDKVTDAGIQYLACHCGNLKELSISDCRNITDFGIMELSRLEPDLRYLSIAKCDKVSDVGIKHIAQNCTKLRYLNCRGCEAVSDESLQLLSQNCHRLRSLDVGKCDITDEGLLFLAKNSPQLKRLSVRSCDGIGDHGIIMIAQHCQCLQQLNVQDCHLSVSAYRTVRRFCRHCIIEHTNPGFY